MRNCAKYSKNNKNVCSDKADLSKSDRSSSSRSRDTSKRRKQCKPMSCAPLSSIASDSSFCPTNNTCANSLTPDMKLEKGDQKCSFTLEDGGKMVKITRKNGTLVYMLRCADGRRVFIEKTEVGACLLMTNQKGSITKSLAAQY